MKISNSKRQLAKIISENGGWREGAKFAAQDQDGEVFFYTERPSRYESVWRYVGVIGGKFIKCDEALPGWHQTILSRDEYFHLYPAHGAVAEEPEHVWTNPPTIEQLAAEYRNRQEYADRKQQEADEAKAEAKAKLKELVAAGKAVGLAVSVVAPEPAPVFQVGDTVRLLRKRSGAPVIGEVGVVVRVDSETDLVINFPSQSRYLVDDTDVELVAKGAANA